jgi:hypothetical protein
VRAGTSILVVKLLDHVRVHDGGSPVAMFPICSARESGDGGSDMHSERGGGIGKGEVVREA